MTVYNLESDGEGNLKQVLRDTKDLQLFGEIPEEMPEDPREGFYTITKEQWDKIPEGYKLHRQGEPRATFLCFLTPDGSGGDVLCFEGQHFQIIDTEEGKQ